MTTVNSETPSQGFLFRHRGKLFLAQAVLFIGVGILIASRWSGTPDSSDPSELSEVPITASPASETTWTCSMHPQIRQPKQGKCPICGMDLIPVAKTSGGLRTLAISDESKALMQISTTPVERRYVSHEIPMIGRVDYDETKLGYITAWVPGRLDRLYVDYTGVEVKEGDHLVYIYSEQLYSAQEELIQALKNRRDRGSSSSTLIQPIDLVESAREKLRLLGLTDEQIKEIEQLPQPQDHLTIYAPLGGIVIEKLKQQGERVQLGERIYTIADLKQVWVHLDAYESDLPWIRYGQDVTITTEAYPGEEFHGRIAFIQPVLNDKTRTVKVRVNVPNPNGKLKPEMFVHAVVRPQVAAGGKVMDPNLADKWISPMHPEIVKDEPGVCDICGMPLVRGESLGYVTPLSDGEEPPLVVPTGAALVTGTRAVVYVQLPEMPSFAEAAFQSLSSAIQSGDLPQIREAFETFGNMLDRTYDRPGTDFARQQWNTLADRLSQIALAGERVSTASAAEQLLTQVESVMTEAREQFAPAERPTFEGREIVLGPQAGDYYLVRNGLSAGEMVVTQGNFKIDAEIQIQAKPSMMTPDGGGGGGHDHGGQGGTAAAGSDSSHSNHAMTLPTEFSKQLKELNKIYEQVAEAVKSQQLEDISAAFGNLEQSIASIESTQLTGHPRMVWKEFEMLLGNDAVEGSEAQQLADADRVFLLLKGHMRRMREQFGTTEHESPTYERLAVTPEFQNTLGPIWQQYVAVGQSLASDDLAGAQSGVTALESAVMNVKESTLDERAKVVWEKERGNLLKLIDQLKKSEDIKSLRTTFLPTSQQIEVLAMTFGFGSDTPIFELHCPMAFQGKGATWYQQDDQVRNPYYGSTMLQCADRVEQIAVPHSPSPDEDPVHENHSHH